MEKQVFDNIEELVRKIIYFKNESNSRAFIVGISGIDGSGKGYVSKLIAESLKNKKISVHIENLDGWLNKPNIRFSDENPGEIFYKKGFRFEELEEKILKPYKNNKYVKAEIDYIEETWDSFEKKHVEINGVDVFILEGIFIFSDKIAAFLDYKIWIECSFETALERAVLRNQEGLTNEEIINAYNFRFFPAQKIHFAVDTPQTVADTIYINDDKLKK